MLDKIEKVIYVGCGVALLGVTVLYAWKPVPDTDPREFIPDSVITSAPPKKLTTPKEGSKQTPLTANKITTEKNKILGKLRKASSRPISRPASMRAPTTWCVRSCAAGGTTRCAVVCWLRPGKSTRLT